MQRFAHDGIVLVEPLHGLRGTPYRGDNHTVTVHRSGDPGVGKTSLLDLAAASLLKSPDLACLEFKKYKVDAKGKPLAIAGVAQQRAFIGQQMRILRGIAGAHAP